MTPLGSTALEIFKEVLGAIDAGHAVKRVVRLEDSNVWVNDSCFSVEQYSRIVSVCIGKAGLVMARALSEVLGDRLSAGVVSAPIDETGLKGNWQVFAGGHPLPNEDSLKAARAAIELLKAANDPSTLVIFMISGGGSAMCELPADENISLSDLRETNRLLVGCGATINEVNRIRRKLSRVKGGKLSANASRARQVTLLVSDTNKGDEHSIASGPSIPGSDDFNNASEAMAVLERYSLVEKLPSSVVNAIADSSEELENDGFELAPHSNQSVFLLLDNRSAMDAAVHAAQSRGFITEVIDDLIESPIEEGCAELVSRLFRLRASSAEGVPVCLVAGGEFVCKVRGNGRGGRNTEASLRCALEIERLLKGNIGMKLRVAVLNAGTDGIDGNSPAAGAVVDESTLGRASQLGIVPQEFLEHSDSYTFFEILGDAIVTGPTGTNVRDLRLLLAI
ncbi:MAG: glycerate 2-kinase [Blastocatellia bacterium]|jgi:hydroxypyruvate reductase|nr:glycerate 2-kinase [Blastocatellia bacterium]